MNADELMEQLVKEAAAIGPQPPCTSLRVCREGRAVELFIDRTGEYGEWINGEGSDICLYRERDTDHVVGIRLPLRHERLIVSHGGRTVVFDGYAQAADAALKRELNAARSEAARWAALSDLQDQALVATKRQLERTKQAADALCAVAKRSGGSEELMATIADYERVRG